MVLKILLAIVGAIVLLGIGIWILNFFTVYPLMYFLRFVSSRNKEFVKSGDYSTQMSQVELKRTILIEDDNIYDPLPSTTASLYGLKNVKTPQPLIVFIHGGGWSLGDESVLSNYMKLLASNGYLVAGVNYALAPEHPYPTSTRQLMLTLNHLYEFSDKYQIDNRNIFIIGNSAGAHLASQLGALITNSDYAYQLNVKAKFSKDILRGLILYNGVYDFKEMDQNKFPFFKQFMWSYTAHKDYMTYDRLDELSPLNYITKDYPDAFVTVGSTDPLHDQSTLLCETLKERDVICQSRIYTDVAEDLNHDFMFDMNKEASITVYEEVIQFIKNRSQ